MSSEKFTLLMATSVVIGILTIICMIGFWMCYHDRDMIQAGYQQVPVYGQTGTVWQKVGEKASITPDK